MSLMRDERGELSMARTLLLVTLILTFFLIYGDTVWAWDVPGPAYALLATIFTGLLTWAAGPRIAQYIGPQIAGAGRAVGSAMKRLRGTDDVRHDDERG